MIIYFGIEVGYNILNHLYHGDFYYFPNIESPVVSIIFAAIIRFGEVRLDEESSDDRILRSTITGRSAARIT